jgi:hypothetical protein
MKARLVLRESDESLRDGYGFENQREDGFGFAGQHGIEIIKVHELVESATKWKREKLEDIIDEAIREKEEIPWLIWPRVDRTARKQLAGGYYVYQLISAGLTVGIAGQNLILHKDSPPMDFFMFNLHLFKAEEDANQIKSNLLGGRDKLAEKAGQVPNGTPIWPFDYYPKKVYGQMTTGKPSLNRERAGWVRKWYEAIVFDSMGVNAIEKWMEREGVRTKRGKRITAKHVRDILTSRQLLGEFSWRGKVYLKDDTLRILTDEEFERLKTRLRENRERSYYNAVKWDYPPLPVVRHGCGQTMRRVPLQGRRGKVAYYRCDRCKGNGHYFQAQPIWQKMRPYLENELLREDRLIPALRAQFADNTAVVTSLETQIAQMDRVIADQEGRQDRAFQLGIEIKGYPAEKVQAEIDKAEEKIQKLKLERAESRRQLQVAKQRILDEEGIRRLCQQVQGNLDSLDKDGWRKLNERIGLQVTIISKDVISAKVALPPIREVENEFSQSLSANALDRAFTSIAL